MTGRDQVGRNAKRHIGDQPFANRRAKRVVEQVECLFFVLQLRRRRKARGAISESGRNYIR